jgi:sn-glycerol 3-phosphate transport system permease protein
MVERRRFGNAFAYLVLSLGVFVIAFPVYLCFIGSTHEQSTIANGQMPITPGGLFLPTYYKTLFVGTSGTTREPVVQMLLNSFVMARPSPSAKSRSRSSPPTPSSISSFPSACWLFG